MSRESGSGKAREFWIFDSSVMIIVAGEKVNENYHRYVEGEAYDRLLAASEKLVEALRFYKHSDAVAIKEVWPGSIERTDLTWKAQQALADYEKEVSK